jgi:hypothetical protein
MTRRSVRLARCAARLCGLEDSFMKFSTRSAVLVLAAVFTQATWAVPKGNAVSGPSPTTARATYVGLASDAIYSGGGGSTSITAAMLNERSAIQVYVGIPTIKGSFVGGGGINYKYSLVGDSIRGFHIGIGMGLGAMNATARTFYINIQPLLGVHFHITDHILLNFDGGLTFQIQTEGSSNFDILLGANSTILGASILFGI